MSADEPLLNMAGDILDGADQDWSALESSLTASQREVFAALRTIALIASSNRAIIAPTDEPSLLGTMWGHLRVQDVVGRGAFGTVYRAWDVQLDREVALKLLDVDPGTNQIAIDEGRLLAKIRHPNVVTVYGADQIASRVGLWMEFVEGATLEQRIRREGPLPALDVLAIGRQLADALAAVHRAGIVHGDVKAHNVVIQDDGRVVLMDFGAGRVSALHMDRAAGGTPLYVAPEVCLGAPPSAQADLYSLGVLLYFLLTGGFPVAGRSLQEIRERHAAQMAPPDVRERRPDAPRQLASALNKALQPLPQYRFATATEMAAALAGQPGYQRRVAAIALIGIATSVAVAATQGPLVRRFFNGSGPAPPASGMTAALAEPTARRLKLPDGLFANGLSGDGRYFSYSTDDGDLACLDMNTSVTESLVQARNGEFAEFAIMSPDGGMAVYEWWTAGEIAEIRLVDRTSKEVRVLVRDEGVDSTSLAGWTSDGRSILIVEHRLDGTRRIALLDVSTGARHAVLGLNGDPPLGLSVSADGRFIAYDARSADRRHRLLHVVGIDGSGDHELPLGPEEDDWSPLWTPDGAGLYFLSDRAGTVDGWILPMAAGAPAGEPTLAVRNLTHVSSLGLTASGTYYYRLQTGTYDIQTVTTDATTSAPTAPPHRIHTRLGGANIAPSYSQDGRRMLYVSVRDGLGPDGDRVLVIRDLESGDERTIVPSVYANPAPPRWSPDGQLLLVRGLATDGQHRGLFVIDSATGSMRQQVVQFAEKDATNYATMGWFPDGRSVVFEQAGRGLVKHTLATGEEEVLYSYRADQDHDRIHRFGFAPSPDMMFAFSAPLRRGGASGIYAVDRGVTRELVSDADGSLVVQGWSPVPREVLYTVAKPNGTSQLWKVDLNGAAQPLGLDIEGLPQINPLAIHPRGTEISYTAGHPVNEIWTVENFLRH